MTAELIRRLLRRATTVALLLSLFVTAGALAQAESTSRRDRTYLTQLFFVLEGARRVLLFGEAHRDAEFARFIYPLSEHYVELAGRMMPSERLKIVHPHLLLVVENIERAFNAAAHGDFHAFQQHVRTIREELGTLDDVLKYLKVRPPEPLR